MDYSVTTLAEVKGRGDVVLGLIKSLGSLANDSTASIFNRFEAIDLLLRLAVAPRCVPADRIDDAGRCNARIALSDSMFFLYETMSSNKNRARIRLHAASLARLVTKMLSYV